MDSKDDENGLSPWAQRVPSVIMNAFINIVDRLAYWWDVPPEVRRIMRNVEARAEYMRSAD